MGGICGHELRSLADLLLHGRRIALTDFRLIALGLDDTEMSFSTPPPTHQEVSQMHDFLEVDVARLDQGTEAAKVADFAARRRTGRSGHASTPGTAPRSATASVTDAGRLSWVGPVLKAIRQGGPPAGRFSSDETLRSCR